VATLDRNKGFGTYGSMRNISLMYGPILAVICCTLDANAAIPDCAGSVEIRDARVVRVEKNGALILSDGRAVMLEGIRLPLDDAALADRALATLQQMALTGPVTFTATPPKEDRYDRVRAQGLGKSWLQAALLEQGLARVAIAPDRNECSPELYAAEGRGRAQHAGLWANAAFAPRAPEQVKGTAGSFQVIEGWVTNVGAGGGRTFIDFGSDGQRIFSAVIAPEDRRAFHGFDLDGLHAKHIRIRGIVQDYRGRPEIALSNPAQIEILN
jgi:endonuclease YncB( thermonuclease family)